MEKMREVNGQKVLKVKVVLTTPSYCGSPDGVRRLGGDGHQARGGESAAYQVIHVFQKSRFDKLKIQAKGGTKMFDGCIADRVIVNQEEVALADVRGFAKVQFSAKSVCR